VTSDKKSADFLLASQRSPHATIHSPRYCCAVSVKSYRELLVWQKSIELAERIYAASKGFPKEESYGLTSQMRRAAVSIPSNIAEGAAREGTGEFLQFLSTARGSLAELETQLLLTERLGYLKAAQVRELEKACDEIGRMLSGLRKSISSKR
jgi:four helix bundle protein